MYPIIARLIIVGIGTTSDTRQARTIKESAGTPCLMQSDKEVQGHNNACSYYDTSHLHWISFLCIMGAEPPSRHGARDHYHAL